MHIVLVEPEIPPNTGNVARLCAATRTTLHLIEPFGFKLDDAQLKRAGMDYWRHVEWRRWRNWAEFEAGLDASARIWLIESQGPRLYTEARFGPLAEMDRKPGRIADLVHGLETMATEVTQ